MNRSRFIPWWCAIGLALAAAIDVLGASGPPNLLIIHTDEHNFRTLGCYREQLPDDQAYVWGPGVKVDTPQIDSIAHAGALCTRFYAASPVCTPSRASLVSGLYPVATGAPSNDMPMRDDVVTFAEILQRNGYATSYVGKWHLDGDAKPGFAPARKFGFDDNRYMFNRGHWKQLRQTEDGAELVGDWNEKKGRLTGADGDPDETSFTTDFLTDRALEILERDQAGPFCLMLSIPDPHGPNSVRAPYDTLYADLAFQVPRTGQADPASLPGWVSAGDKNAGGQLKPAQQRAYFGMVKCIDDNVGRILAFLAARDLDRNTIVIFTSDHGDLMGEHGRINKGLPYEASAKIPFVIRWPGKIRPGKIIRTAYTTVDFAPTLLGLMGVEGSLPAFHGADGSADFLGPEAEVRDDRIVYITNSGSRWVAAVNHRYKLVLSPSDPPWLFDLEQDPDEVTNYYTHPDYREIAATFTAALNARMNEYDEPALKRRSLILPEPTRPVGIPAPQKEPDSHE